MKTPDVFACIDASARSGPSSKLKYFGGTTASSAFLAESSVTAFACV